MAFSCEPLQSPPLTVSPNFIPSCFAIPDGSLSAISIMNGASSEGVADTGGQYGSVRLFSHVSRGPKALC